MTPSGGFESEIDRIARQFAVTADFVMRVHDGFRKTQSVKLAQALSKLTEVPVKYYMENLEELTHPERWLDLTDEQDMVLADLPDAHFFELVRKTSMFMLRLAVESKRRLPRECCEEGKTITGKESL